MKVKCAYCSKPVELSKKGNLTSHLCGGKHCVGIGFDGDRMKRLSETRDKAAEEKNPNFYKKK